MKFSILPVFIIAVFAFCIFITKLAKRTQSINTKEAWSVYTLLLVFGLWTLVSIIMGMKQLHVPLMDQIPLLWQACVAVVIASIGLLSKDFRSAVRGIADATPAATADCKKCLRSMVFPCYCSSTNFSIHLRIAE